MIAEFAPEGSADPTVELQGSTSHSGSTLSPFSSVAPQILIALQTDDNERWPSPAFLETCSPSTTKLTELQTEVEVPTGNELNECPLPFPPSTA